MVEPIDEDDESQYPSKSKLVFIILGLDLALFLVGLDNTIISSAIPKITDHFHALNDVGWYASAYLLTICSTQLMWEKLYTFYSVKWVFLASLFIFELGSLVCGVAPTSTALIVGRAVAGIGGGGVGTGCFLLIAYSVPRRRRPTFVGMMGAMYRFAAIAGSLLGGAFTENASMTWRWCFYINLPWGVIPATIIIFFIQTPKAQTASTVSFVDQLKQMDPLGTITLLPGVICLLLALQWGGSTYAWHNGRIIAPLVLTGVFLIAFVFIQIRGGDQATIPMRVFHNRNIWGSALFGAGVEACFYVMLYYVSLSYPHLNPADCLASYLVPGYQRRQRHSLGCHEPADDHQLCDRLCVGR